MSSPRSEARTSPRTITVDLSDRNGSRWTNPNWMNADLARITDISGQLPRNHFTERVPVYMAFAAWLDVTVKPETFNTIMSNENAFHQAYSAYRNLASFQARMTKKNHTNSEAQPAGRNSSNV